MIVLKVRNVHQALPMALDLLNEEGQESNSRNGRVLRLFEPVTTVYLKPQERVIFWPQRDANPFLHLYEAMWMLAGRKDVRPLMAFTKHFQNYSDDGVTLHDAYGYRWRHWFHRDQLDIVVKMLTENPNDRRCVIQMWDACSDLDRNGLAVPCNLTATVQLNRYGALNLVVFNRSNDIVWGCYGANAVHFSFLQEYLAHRIGVPMGTYTQVSVNWHGYLTTLAPLKTLPKVSVWDRNTSLMDPYQRGEVFSEPMNSPDLGRFLDNLMLDCDSGFQRDWLPHYRWERMIYRMLRAHHVWKNSTEPERHSKAMEELDDLAVDPRCDWIVAAKEWLERRHEAWYRKMAREYNTLEHA